MAEKQYKEPIAAADLPGIRFKNWKMGFRLEKIDKLFKKQFSITPRLFHSFGLGLFKRYVGVEFVNVTFAENLEKAVWSGDLTTLKQMGVNTEEFVKVNGHILKNKNRKK